MGVLGEGMANAGMDRTAQTFPGLTPAQIRRSSPYLATAFEELEKNTFVKSRETR
jgi:hypothetical protein